MSPKQTIICVLGMHRSGTSVVSKMLSLLGAYLGPGHRTMLPTSDNPKGFWEHTGFVDINDEILTRFGGDWHNAPEFPEGWARLPKLEDLRKRAAEIVDREFRDAPVWSWKDPRTCLTIPFWQQLLPEMQYLICVRDPVAVARSLEKRDGFSVDKSGRLWLTHTASALRWTSGRRRLLVCYEDIMRDCEPELRRVAAFLDATARLQPQLLEDVRGFLDESLYHHRPRLTGSVDEPSMIFPAKSLYLALRGSFSRPKDEGATELDAAVDAYAALAVEEDAANVRSVLRDAALRQDLADARQHVQALALDESTTPQDRQRPRREEVIRQELIAAELRASLVDEVEQGRSLARRNEHLAARVESATRVTSNVRHRLRRARTDAAREAAGLAASAGRFFRRSTSTARALGLVPGAATLGTGKCLFQLAARPGLLRDAYLITSSGVFDPDYYLRRNPDVAASRMRPLMHFMLTGEVEGRQPHPLFDTRWYLSMWPDVGRTRRSVLAHFLVHGSREGRDPHPLFSVEFYRAGLGGSRPIGENALVDYVTCGGDEGRAPHPLFDSAYYLEENPDVAAAGIDPLVHFTHFGAFEGRNPHPLFDVGFYLSQNRDVAASGVNPLIHYWYGAGSERRNAHPLFDAAHYLATNPEVQRARGEPLAHFLADGAARGRNPNPLFDCSYYATQVPEVAAGRVNALVHFVREGWQTGQNPSRDFDTGAYLRDHPDVREWGGNPLVHYIHFGRGEGRTIRVAGASPHASAWPSPYDGSEFTGHVRDAAPRLAGSFAVYRSSFGSWSIDAIADLLAAGLQDLGVAVEERDERQGFSDNADWHIVVAPHQFFYLGAGPDLLRKGTPSQLILLNTEEPSTPSFSLALACFSRAHSIWDLCYESARLMSTKGYRCSYVALGYSPRFTGGREVPVLQESPATAFLEPEARTWASSNPRSLRPIDVLFVGHVSNRRSRFFARVAPVLSQYRCCLHLSTPAPEGTERSKHMTTTVVAGLAQRSKIVLNIHHGPERSFEWGRMVLGGLWQRALVVSEPCAPAPPFRPGVDFIEVPIDGLASTIDYLLSKSDGQANADRIAAQGFKTLTTECLLTDTLRRLILELRDVPGSSDDSREPHAGPGRKGTVELAR